MRNCLERGARGKRPTLPAPDNFLQRSDLHLGEASTHTLTERQRHQIDFHFVRKSVFVVLRNRLPGRAVLAEIGGDYAAAPLEFEVDRRHLKVRGGGYLSSTVANKAHRCF